ncbi:GntR family transcriptional regulator [Streptomonospora sp. PA3]|uniref:GntR family transcriptional regulator n=1 Tax=Streptomonospora sp. PA3 TaxID=2607326 RepID=UPI0012DCD989|nr:GntR family transcriptional regulator [Streptomonospora sp. PA3]MUL42541.1 GntR family transcriptional regulator [Streptomonospora sp. PA3]
MAEIPRGYGPDDEIDHEAPDPVYLQLCAILVARIDSGRYPPRRVVPGIERLVQEFGVARGTARKSLLLLSDLGYLRIVPGKGAYVRQE